MAHFFAREAFLVPAALRATAGMAQRGEPLFLLSKFDGLLRGGFEVKQGPQQGHEDGSASVPFVVARESLLEFAVPLAGSGLLDVLGADVNEDMLGSQSCLELELWQADAIQGLLEEMAAHAHAGEHGTADASSTLADEEIARALHVEMEQERAREATIAAERRERVAVEVEERRMAVMLAVKHEAEARAYEQEALRLAAEEERLRHEDERLRRRQEEADAARAHELQAQFDQQADTQADADAAAAHAMQAQFDSQANERMAQQLADEQQARALHVAMRAAAHPLAGANACAPCAPSAPSTSASASVPMGHPVSPPAPGAASKNAGRKLVVIDALNVGRSYNVGFTCPEHHHFKIHKQHSWKAVPCCATAIALAIDYFLSKGYRVEAFLPEWAYYGGKNGNMFAHDHRLLEKYVDPSTGVAKTIMTCPAGADDDKFILQRAKNALGEGYEVIVLSNDMYRDHIAAGTIDDAFMKKHAVKFQWLHGNQLFPMLV